ncbi:hypothetical protein SK854_32410 [Lentzea sp. BCCO 10_0061]|uniref:Uncharacterized protein n=1 Tax=Lentzea sokolovensis TaxID=3095429 RepID=A0ABU4V509_9PSEU|nr:hypothetical protein [Lentzea sp. BCCO 10_0061]MDX8146856.1 hypothetical protein [Lentzea sp. BCCO 10_0061]
MGELMGAFTAAADHGCLLLEDEQPAGLRHDSWNPAEVLYDVEDDSVIFSVIPSVDGMVTVRVWRGEPEPGCATLPYFSGVLVLSRGKFMLRDPEDTVTMTFYLERGPNAFYVLTDSVEYPESVDIVFSN